MNRRIRNTILGVGAGMLLAGTSAVAQQQDAERPNILILYADDMGYGDLGANNPESKIPTPNLDRLAGQGMRFTDGHSSSGICTPSRFAMLTGQHHWRRFHGIVGAFGQSVFKPDDFTLAKMFKAKGYNTACVGKWHLGWDWNALKKENAPTVTVEEWGKKKQAFTPEAFDWSKPIPDGPCAQGFDYYFGDGTINFPPYCWVENDRVTEIPTKMVSEAGFQALEGQLGFRHGPMVAGWDPYKVLPTDTDKAVAWLEKQSADTPFFLYVAFPSPHEPIIPSAEYRGTSQAGFYGDYVVETDAMAGRIIQTLEKKGFSENTMVVFTSDNGPEGIAYNRLKKYGHWSSGPLRGVKRDVWEGGHRVPFVIRWPGKVAEGAVSDETISQVDLAATFASAVGYPLAPNEAIDSYDLLPVLLGRDYPKPLRKATVQNTYAKVYALRQGDWVFIDGTTGEHSKCPAWFNEERGYGRDSSPGLLYNLKNDLAQHHNLYAEYPETASEMKLLLERYKGGEGCAPHAK